LRFLVDRDEPDHGDSFPSLNTLLLCQSSTRPQACCKTFGKTAGPKWRN
jgi:hypothetical protein